MLNIIDYLSLICCDECIPDNAPLPLFLSRKYKRQSKCKDCCGTDRMPIPLSEVL